MKKLYILFLLTLFGFTTSFSQSNWVNKNTQTTSDLQAVFFTDSLHGWIATYDGNVLKTSDGGESWISKNTGNAFPLYSIFFTDSLNGWTGGYLGKVLHTSDGGNNWAVQTSGLTDIANSIYFLDDSTGFISGAKGNILSTTNGGLNWYEVFYNSGFSFKTIDFLDNLMGFVVGSNGVFLKTTDGGVSWNQINNSYTESFNSVKFINQDMGFVIGTGGLILRTLDGGISWIKMTSPSTSNLNSIMFEDELNGWICGANGTILNTKNGGSSWSNSAPAGQDTYTSLSLSEAGNVFVCGYNGSALKFYPTLTETQTVQNPGDTLDFSNLGLLLSFLNFTPPITGLPQVQVSGHSKSPVHSPVNDSIAGLFNKFYWNIESNLDTFQVSMCVLYDSTRFNTNALQLLNLMYSKSYGKPWQVIEVTPFRLPGRICATINHFSNWTIGLSKPGAKVRIDTIFYNSTPENNNVKINNDVLGMEYGFRQYPGQTDTIFARRYDINPGGDFPPEITGFLGNYYEFRSPSIDTVFMYIDLGSQVDFNESDKTNYVLLHRPDPSLDWTIVSTQRVRRGLKETMFVKKTDFSGQYIIGKTYGNNNFFSVIPTVTPGCLNDTTYFTVSVSGGEGNSNITWSGDENFSGSGSDQWYIFTSIDTVFYTVSAEDENKAETYIDTNFVIDCVTGINYENENNPLSVYPNPSKDGNYFISFPWDEKTDITLLNSLGTILYSQTIYPESNGRNLILKTGNLPQGIYMLKIQTKTNLFGKMIIR